MGWRRTCYNYGGEGYFCEDWWEPDDTGELPPVTVPGYPEPPPTFEPPDIDDYGNPSDGGDTDGAGSDPIYLPADPGMPPEVPDTLLPPVVVTAPAAPKPAPPPLVVDPLVVDPLVVDPLVVDPLDVIAAGSIPFVGGAVPRTTPTPRRSVPRRRPVVKPAPRRRFTPSKIPKSVPGIKAQPSVLARLMANPLVKNLIEAFPRVGRIVGGGARIITNPVLMLFGWTDIGEEPNMIRMRPRPDIDRNADTYTTLPEQQVWAPTPLNTPSASQSPSSPAAMIPWLDLEPSSDSPVLFVDSPSVPSTRPTSQPVLSPGISVSPSPASPLNLDLLPEQFMPSPSSPLAPSSAPTIPEGPRNPDRNPQPIGGTELLLGMPTAAGCPKSEPKKKSKPRKPRTKCYKGTFIETSKSTRKQRKEEIPCQ